jgi:hypothetical protein
MEGVTQMSDTPETDALNAERQEVHASFFIMLNHALKLERERNQAREALVRLCRAAIEACDRWDTPLWKDAPATARFMQELREAFDAASSILENDNGVAFGRERHSAEAENSTPT